MNTVQIQIEREPTVRQLLSFAEQVSQSGREVLLGSAVRTVRAQSLIGLMSLGLRKGDVVTVLDCSGAARQRPANMTRKEARLQGRVFLYSKSEGEDET